MTFQWDTRKAKANITKHGISFANAVSVFEDEYLMTIEEDCVRETRCIALGMDSFGRILVIVYACRNDEIRIISARKATAREQKQYLERA